MQINPMEKATNLEETSEGVVYATNLHKCSNEEKEKELKIKTFVVIKNATKNKKRKGWMMTKKVG